MSHETVEVQRGRTDAFGDMSSQEILLYADLANCNTIELRVVQYYLVGMSNSEIAQEFNAPVDFVGMTIAATEVKLHDMKSKITESKIGRHLKEVPSSPDTVTPSQQEVRSLQDQRTQNGPPSKQNKVFAKVIETAQLYHDVEIWQLRAACRPDNPEGFIDPNVFYPGEKDTPQIHAAKEICKRCVVKQECLQTALDTNENFGIWGGLDPNERKRFKRLEEKKQRNQS